MGMSALKLVSLVSLLAACSGSVGFDQVATGEPDFESAPSAQISAPAAQPVAAPATETAPGNPPEAVQPKPAPAPVAAANAGAPKAEPSPAPVVAQADAGPPAAPVPAATEPHSVPVGGDCETDVDCSDGASCLAGSQICHLGKLRLGDACTTGDPCRCRQLYGSWPPVFACCSALDSACIQ
jgi:hypothetical protein